MCVCVIDIDIACDIDNDKDNNKFINSNMCLTLTSRKLRWYINN